ncbi:3,4-dehydroadipyl-CoA semialdehyde dehydrogenase [bioreactor metagenome]|uniref:3,4-dehydroadipyl-CoA semialdehyde dehydrogenase n=1 Tax=bioreactor metagenome TaxID=1076179 RepID=A0A644Z1S8_9ZZZZ
MSELLANYLGGRWQHGSGKGVALVDPVLGHALARVDATGMDLPAAFAFARDVGGAALRSLSYEQRARLLADVAAVLQRHRDAYYEISTANSGTVKNDTAVDVDGAIYTIGQYAKWGAALGAARHLKDGDAVALAKDGVFQSQHVQVPTRGVALFINAFNFPAWGLWEKAAPALLSGVPVIVKPATATAWLTQRMVKDVVDAGVLPAGALSVICGSSAGLMEQLLVREVVREMTVKSGQKCTAIRRVLVPSWAACARSISITARRRCRPAPMCSAPLPIHRRAKPCCKPSSPSRP